MAEISSVRSPNARSRLKVSRPDRPASTRMRVALDATSAQFPRLPLASTDTDTPIAVAYPHRLWKRGSFSVAGTFGGTAPVGAPVDGNLFLSGNPSRPRASSIANGEMRVHLSPFSSQEG